MSTLPHWLATSIVEAYLDDCADRGLAAKTIDWYRWHLTRAIHWLHQAADYHSLDLLHPTGLRAYYRSTAGLAVTTRHYLVACLQAFGAWLQRDHHLDNPAAGLKKPRLPKTMPHVLPPTDLARLLQVLDGEEPRERALVLLFLDAGLRVSELIHLTRRDLDLDAAQLWVRDGKGGKDRLVFYSEGTAAGLRAYLATHDNDEVFVSRRPGRPAGPLTDNGVRQILRALADRHGFQDLRPHTLRRTCGTELAANGVDLSTIADQFGHEDIATTRIYTRLADSRRREVLRRASPIQRHQPAGIPVPDWPRPHP